MVKEVTFENFEDVVDQNPMVFLEFWTAGCKSCKMLDPVFTTLAELNPDIFFGKVNAETAQDLAQAFQIKAVPTLMIFKNSELVFEHPGLLPPEAFEPLLENLRK